MKVLVLDFDGVITGPKFMQLGNLARPIFSTENGGIGRVGRAGRAMIKPLRLLVELQATVRGKPFDDIEPAIQSFPGPVYVASLQTTFIIKLFLRRYGLLKYFKEIVGGDRFETKAEQLSYIIGKEGQKQFILVDNAEEHIAAAEKLGMKGILLNRNAQDSLIEKLRCTTKP